MKRTNITSEWLMNQYIKMAGFTPICTTLKGAPDDRVSYLGYLLERGSGILHINHPEIGGHVIVLDEISPRFTTFRDPYHGWMTTVETKIFKTWIAGQLIQFQSRKSPIRSLSAPEVLVTR